MFKSKLSFEIVKHLIDLVIWCFKKSHISIVVQFKKGSIVKCRPLDRYSLVWSQLYTMYILLFTTWEK